MKIHNYEEQKFTLNQFTGEKISGVKFYSCDFSETDLTETQFINCHFWHPDKQVGCDFSGAILMDGVQPDEGINLLQRALLPLF
ncbi:pentapeptide repeat-containing protein [Salmonella enterica subsp. salamae]|nr:pentapeptide repeat-containing protein [Salmonella enterica subsp. salamae]